MPQLGWYLKRVRVMSGPEILHRVWRISGLARLYFECRLDRGLAGTSPRPGDLAFCRGHTRRLPEPNFDIDALRRAATALLDGRMRAGGRDWQWSASPDAWHRAPDTQRLWPSTFFGGIAYLAGNPYGEIRPLWEVARLQQLVDLAMLARIGTDAERNRSLQMIADQLGSWVERNPSLRGPHYISSMECALRLIAVCHALDLVRDLIRDEAPWSALARIVHSHAPLIERRLSLHSSTGNHTVAEAAGLVYAALLFPELPGSQRRLDTGLALIGRLAQTQVFEDGGGVEQAVAYHEFNTQIFSMVNFLLATHGRPAIPGLSDTIKQARRFLDSLRAASGKLPIIGDQDGGHALSSCVVLQQGTAPLAEPAHFENSGYTLASIATRPNTCIIVDHGPLGMPPAFGHGHADALSVLLSVAGREVLIDPGNYTYTGDQGWRRYYRSTRAHNTVTVDGIDQARQDGSFLWSRPYHCRVIARESDAKGGRLLVEHDGYSGIGVQHVRGVGWLRNRGLLVWDQLTGDGMHDCELHWHLGIEPRQDGADRFVLDAAGCELHLELCGGTVSVHRGECEPMRGWRSPSYGSNEPAHTIRVHAHGSLPREMTTLVRFNRDDDTQAWIAPMMRWMRGHAR